MSFPISRTCINFGWLLTCYVVPKAPFIKDTMLYEPTKLNIEDEKIGNSKTFLNMQEPSINSKSTMPQIPGVSGGAHP